MPTPGSPPTRTSDAGTSPPPRTRSSSGTPVGMRLGLLGLDVDEAEQRARRRDGRGVGLLGRSSTSVPNVPQHGHLPNQRPDE